MAGARAHGSVSVAWPTRALCDFTRTTSSTTRRPLTAARAAAIVVARTGEVIGLHKELVNTARELLKHKATVGERLNRVEVSVKSLIKGSSFGSICVRLDSDIARSLLDAAT